MVNDMATRDFVDGVSKGHRDEMSLKDVMLKLRNLYLYLLSNWIVVLSFGFVGSILGFSYAYFKQPVYIARTTFVLESGDGGDGMAQYAGLASMVGLDIGGGAGNGIFKGDNILELYKSRNMIEKALLTEVKFHEKKQLLVDRFVEFNDLRKSWRKNPDLVNFKFDRFSTNNRLQDSILGTIVTDIYKNYLNVFKPDKKLSIISAEVKSNDEFFSEVFNNEIVNHVNEFYVQTKTKKSLNNVTILQRKVDSVRSVMNGAIYSAAVVLDATPNLNPTRQVQRSAPMQRSQFSAETNKAILAELVKNLELSKMSLLRETPLIQVIDQPVLPLEKERFGKIKGGILGGMAFVFFAFFFLVFKRILRKILND